jgi:hypothetical protein
MRATHPLSNIETLMEHTSVVQDSTTEPESVTGLFHMQTTKQLVVSEDIGTLRVFLAA